MKLHHHLMLWIICTARYNFRPVQFLRDSPIAIDLFCSLILTISVAEIQVCKVNAHFLLDLPRQP